MITHFLIDTNHLKLRRNIVDVLAEKGCVIVFDIALQPEQSAGKLMLYTCNNTVVYLAFKGETLFIDIQGENATEIFEEISKILPPEHSFVRRIVRGF